MEKGGGGDASCTIDLEKRTGEGLYSNFVVYRMLISVTLHPLPSFLCLVLLEWVSGWGLGLGVFPLGLIEVELSS